MTILTIICILVGAIIMGISAWRTRHIVHLISEGKYSGRWKRLYYLMVVFLTGYVMSIIVILEGDLSYIELLAGVIFFGGAIFVLLVVQTGYATLKELFSTTVSKQYVESIIRSMADTLIVVNLDKEKKIETVNAATLSLLSYDYDDLVGSSISLIIQGKEDGQKIIDEILLHKHVIDKEVEYKKKDGTTFPVLFSGSVLKDLDGKIEGVVCVGQDISERKKAQEALENANGMKELLLDIITHDLKNPAGVIYGMVKILKDDDPEKMEYGLLESSSENLINVIKNATTLSKVAMDEALSKEDLDLSPMVISVINEYESAIKYKKMTINNMLPEAIKIKANLIIVEVFKNYLSNAIKYATEGKNIDIYAAIEDESATLFFRDYGNTIPEKDRERIFIRKAQLQQDKTKGTGLGLAIVKRIVELHKGKVWVEPNMQKGNIFCVTLPKQ